ncbi:MAG: hypothetical protein M3Q72_00345 [Actinomycetota bacterium]|nr:hypothetical protein [Actinomycetota bacterium]
MEKLFSLMARQHSVVTTSQARGAGLNWRIQQRLLDEGVLSMPHPQVLRASGMPLTFESRAMAAALAPGAVAISHGAAARLHGLDGFDRYETIDVIGRHGAVIEPSVGMVVHVTRGPVTDDVVTCDAIPTLSIAATLALLAPVEGIGRTARALDSALRLGVESDELARVAKRWQRRGRSGPPALRMLLGERVDQRLPRSWFQRLAKRVLAEQRIRLVDEYPVRDERGVLLAELDLADPVRRVGVECQSWRWHATPAAQHRDARRRGMLRMLGWEIVDVWWSDLRQLDRVLAELRYLLHTRSDTATAPA